MGLHLRSRIEVSKEVQEGEKSEVIAKLIHPFELGNHREDTDHQLLGCKKSGLVLSDVFHLLWK